MKMVQITEHVKRNVTVKSSKMAETAFSEDGNYFSSISQDGRLRIWDTETGILKQEYTPDLHLAAPPSCLRWITVIQNATPQKKDRRKSSSGELESQCIALGTTSGKILIYSVSQAKVETVLEEINNEITRSNITSLDWHKKFGLYSCNKESVICEWDLSAAQVRNKYNVNIDSKSKQASYVSAIKIVPHSQKTAARYLVTASTQIRVWRLHGGDAELVKCLGHAASPKALLTVAELNNTCWLVEGSQNERLISFWDVTVTSDLVPQVNGEGLTPNRKKRKKSVSSPVNIPTPTYNFVLEDAPKQIDVDVREENGKKLSLAAVTRSGVLHYYGHMLNGASSKPIKPTVTIQVTTADAQPLPLQCCHFPSTGDILLGYSKAAALIFERITPDLKTKTQVLIRGDSKEPKKKSKQNESNKVRGDSKLIDVTYVEPMGGVSRKRATPGATVEVPMEERLANLTVDSKSRRQAAVNQNLTKLLMQGLHSKDRRLILSVLQNNKPSVAVHTVAALPADYVPILLDQLADMAARKTSQCASVCTWLSAVLRCHSALLLATINSSSSHHLAHLLAIFTNRRSHLCQLLNLKGRLELTMAQRDQKQTNNIQQQPLLHYNDSSSEEEMEIEKAQSDTEQSWDADSEEQDVDASDGSDDDSE